MGESGLGTVLREETSTGTVERALLWRAPTRAAAREQAPPAPDLVGALAHDVLRPEAAVAGRHGGGAEEERSRQVAGSPAGLRQG